MDSGQGWGTSHQRRQRNHGPKGRRYRKDAAQEGRVLPCQEHPRIVAAGAPGSQCEPVQAGASVLGAETSLGSSYPERPKCTARGREQERSRF